MSTIRRNFFQARSRVVRRQPPTSAPATRARSASNASRACNSFFAEHLNKGIFFAKHLRTAHSIASHQRANKMWKWSISRHSGIREPPTIGSPIRHRTSRFAQKLRKLFPPCDRHRGRSQCVRRRCRTSCPDMCRRVSHRCAWREQSTGTSPTGMPWPRFQAWPHTRMSPRTTPLPGIRMRGLPAQKRRCRRGAARPASCCGGNRFGASRSG